jgi:outer membrane receptor protein involved in Fe transport
MPATASSRSDAARSIVAAACKLTLPLLLYFPGIQLATAQTPAAAAPATPAETSAETPAEASSSVLEEITVTATRQEQSLSRVPISVSVETRDAMDLKGIKDFSDVVRFTPGVSFDADETNRISIRGISSSGGSGTTGIYIDDVPIQIRSLGFNADDSLLKVFDLDRIEILRGPQGTLFGAGSEGGTVRYITSQPDLTKPQLYARAESSFTDGGALSYETGVSAGTPIIPGELAVKGSVYYRRDGGWIDRIDPTTLNVVEPDSNFDRTTAVRLAAIWQPTSALTITPSFFYQDRERNDVTIYWPIYSNPGGDHFVSANPTRSPEPDAFYLPALNVQLDLGPTRLISTTSFFHRDDQSEYDGTLYNLSFYQSFGSADFPLIDGSGLHLPDGLVNYRSPTTVTNQQRDFTEELRLQSTDRDARVNWTVGAFVSINRQFSLEQIHDPMADTFFFQEFGQGAAAFFGDTTDTNPDGSSILPMGDSYFNSLISHDRQFAGFGEADINVTDKLKVLAGARIAYTQFSISSLSSGPQNGGPRPGAHAASETPVTPKLGLSYQADSNDLYYATYAKGFRSGGGNPEVPGGLVCGQDFANFGISGAPDSYKSDTVQSFEIGAKNNLNNTVRLATSFYYIKWNNIQQNVVPPICQIQWTQNLGAAVSKGFDLQADFDLGAGFSLETAVGYTDAQYTENAFVGSSTGGALPVVAKGDAVVDAIVGENSVGTPPWTVTISPQYKFNVFSHESFARLDYEYGSGEKWLAPSRDSRTSQYDNADPTRPSYTLPLIATHFVSLRVGTQIDRWALSLFADNLLNSHTITNSNHQVISYDDSGATLATPLYRDITFRPLTIGVTAVFKF